MKLNAQTLDYLHSKKFSNSLQVPLNFYGPIPNRVAFLTQLIKGKKVIHFGCLDHLPLIDEKIARKQWLHKEITENAAACIGVDIDEEAKAYVENKYGYRNIILGDFTKTKPEAISNQVWDYAVLGEILEHIDNPVSYLQAIKQNYSDTILKIVVTVPNAWTQTTMKKANQSVEIINSDHRYWFTPYTLCKVIARAGMEVEDIFFANRVPLNTPMLMRSKLLKALGREAGFNFTFASSIVAVAHLSNGKS
jgi:hypothetical protein